MKLEVKDYTYESMPDYSDVIEGAKEIQATGDEIDLIYCNDVVYDHKSDTDLHLQIIKPEIFNDPERIFPCVVYVQGSAWKKQDVHKNVVNVGKLAALGYVCAIVEYRHSGIAHFPAQIIDAKNAVRYMKAHHEEYHLNPDQVFIMGGSSGGHVTCLTGMTAKTDLFDEPMNDLSCEVSGIISQYGAIELTLEDGFPTTVNHQLPDSPEGMEAGYNIRENMEKAQEMNAKTYVKEEYPPVLLLHGTKDRSVFCQQSVNLYEAMKANGKEVELYLVRGSDHGGAAFWKDETLRVYDQFMKNCLHKV